MSNHRRGGTSHIINHDKVLTTKQTDFVNKELNTSKGIMSIKKIVMQDKSVDTESDNAYQKALLTETENDKKKSPAEMKEWSILSDHVKYVTSDGSEIVHKLNIDQMIVKLNQVQDLKNRIKFLSYHKVLPVNLTWLSQVYGKMFRFPIC